MNRNRMAAFAFRLAREATGNLTATYRREGSRFSLVDDPAFRKAFDEVKKRIGELDFRLVQEDDPVRQAVLEIYVAVAPPDSIQ